MHQENEPCQVGSRFVAPTQARRGHILYRVVPVLMLLAPVYGTRGGPWEPIDRQYGYCFKGSTVYVHLLNDYPGTTFKVPPLGKLRAKRAYDVYTGNALSFEANENGTAIRDIDRTSSPADSVVAVVFDREIQSVWRKETDVPAPGLK